MKRQQIYIDTSVVGGCLDKKFKEESRAFFDAVETGKFVVVISDILLAELSNAPEEVQKILEAVA